MSGMRRHGTIKEFVYRVWKLGGSFDMSEGAVSPCISPSEQRQKPWFSKSMYVKDVLLLLGRPFQSDSANEASSTANRTDLFRC